MKELPLYDICSLSEFRNNELLISRFAPYLESHHHLKLPHRHSFFHLVLFTEGTGSHTIDFHKFPVKPFQIYFMVPGQVHRWDFKEKVDGYIINFTESFFQSFLLRANYMERFSFFQGIPEDSVIDIPPVLQGKVMEMFEEVLGARIDRDNLELDHVRSFILTLLFRLNEIKRGKEPETSSSYNFTLLRNFRKLIEKHYVSLRLPKEYAELLYITPNHLNAICNEVYGMSAGQLIRNRVVLEAKRLLVNLELSIAQIAYQLDFNDNSYFTKFFKKQVGSTPEEFRKQIVAITAYAYENT